MAESKVNRENFIVIQGWMLTDLNLKGNELIIYSCIWGFSQAENQVFNGSLQYLADWTNSTKQGVMKNLKALVEKGYIEKEENYIKGVKFCSYRATKLTEVLNKVNGGMKQSLTGGNKQSLTNNISLDNKDYKQDYKKEDKLDNMDKSEFSPYEPNSLTKQLIAINYIEQDDLFIDQYNKIFSELTKSYSFEIVRSCLWYFMKRYKESPVDEEGNEIANKLAYFRTAMMNGAARLQRDNSGYSGVSNGVGSWLYN